MIGALGRWAGRGLNRAKSADTRVSLCVSLCVCISLSVSLSVCLSLSLSLSLSLYIYIYILAVLYVYIIDPIAFNVYNSQHLTMGRNTAPMLCMMPYTTTMAMRTIRSVAFSQRPLPGCTYLPGQVVWLQRKYLMLKFWLTESGKDWAIATMKEDPGMKTVQTQCHWFWRMATK